MGCFLVIDEGKSGRVHDWMIILVKDNSNWCFRLVQMESREMSGNQLVRLLFFLLLYNVKTTCYDMICA